MASNDFIKRKTTFHFIDFFTKTKNTTITLNHEIDSYKWIDPDLALENLDLIDSTRDFLENYNAFTSTK